MIVSGPEPDYGHPYENWPQTKDGKPPPVEIHPSDFDVVYDEDGYSEEVVPEWLPMDETKCSSCDELIAYVYTVEEDSWGREREGYVWVETWQLADGRLRCTDCVDDPDS